jgi:hypothetical protein
LKHVHKLAPLPWREAARRLIDRFASEQPTNDGVAEITAAFIRYSRKAARVIGTYCASVPSMVSA